MRRKPRHSSPPDLPSDILPIFEAIQASDADEVVRLLREGVSPNLQDEEGFTPLHYAASGNKVHLVTLLCDAGANTEARTSRKNEIFPSSTPLHCTIEGNCLEAAAELIRFGADLDARNSHGETPLRLAVETLVNSTLRSPIMARLFIGAGAYVNAMDNGGWTIFEEASKSLELSPGDSASREIVALLQEAGAR